MVLPDLSNPSIALFYAFYYGLVFLAALAGDWPERLGALIFALVIPAQGILYANQGGQQFLETDLGLLAIDTAAFACLVLIALNADRYWPSRAAGMISFSVFSHLVRAFWPPFREMSYLQFNALPTILAVAIVAIGAGTFRMRKWKGYEDRAWIPHAKQAKIRKILGI